MNTLAVDKRHCWVASDK